MPRLLMFSAILSSPVLSSFCCIASPRLYSPKIYMCWLRFSTNICFYPCRWVLLVLVICCLLNLMLMLSLLMILITRLVLCGGFLFSLICWMIHLNKGIPEIVYSAARLLARTIFFEVMFLSRLVAFYKKPT